MRKPSLDPLCRSCRLTLTALLALCLMAGCGDEDGGSDVPPVRTEMVEAEINHESHVGGITTDDGETLIPTNVITATVADTLMRCVCRYAPLKDGFAQVYSLTAILAPHPRQPEAFQELHFDPVHIKSVWKAKRLPYVNLHLGVLTSDVGTHTYGFVVDSVREGKSFFSLYHQRPEEDAEAYTRETYLSLPLTDVPETDSVILHIYTYDGLSRFAF